MGNNRPIELGEFITTLEKVMGKKALKNLLPMQPGDVVTTYADVEDLMEDFDFKPTASIAQGLEKFVQWYQEHYGLHPTNKQKLAKNQLALLAG